MKSNNTWILLRGLAREKGHWGPFPEQLKEAFPGREVLCIDLPGVGEFRELSSPTRMQEIFEFVRGQAVEKAKAQSSFTLLAISLGGMVAMEWMRQRPSDLSGCVMINTSVGPLSPIYRRLRWQVWGRFLRLVTMKSPRERERAIIELLMNNEEVRAGALALWSKLAMERPIRHRVVLHQLLAASRYEGLTEPTSVPVLLLSGLGDRLVDPSCSQDLQERWGWSLERHPWAGHDLPWDDPEWTLNKLRAWAGAKA